MLNKPTGVVSATQDGDTTVIDLLPDELRRIGLFPCGRLDKNTVGLMLLTNDGELSHKLLAPKSHVEKSYRFRAEHEVSEADAEALSRALTSAYKSAYSSVAKPVEGTMLTVMRESATALENALPLGSVDEAISAYLAEARRSLAGTPELLPILRKAGVVDSGGSGVVCFFEGIEKYLLGEEIGAGGSEEKSESFDFSLVNKDTSFDYGYCVEGLIQLRCDTCDFDHDAFKSGLEQFGESVVSTVVSDKLKIHVHTKILSRLMEYCQATGEFLTIKIENMTLQNIVQKNEEQVNKFLVREDSEPCDFAIVAVATNSVTQKMFSDMGADVVIMSDIAPSSRDFLDCFERVKDKKNIVVFPNSSNSILTAMQASTMYRDAIVSVVNSRSSAECYVALAMIDFDADTSSAIAATQEVLYGITEFSLYAASKDVIFGSTRVAKDDFFSLNNNNILATGHTLENVTLTTLKDLLEKNEIGIVNLFYSSDISEDYIENLKNSIYDLGFDVEVASVMFGESACCLTVICE